MAFIHLIAGSLVAFLVVSRYVKFWRQEHRKYLEEIAKIPGPEPSVPSLWLIRNVFLYELATWKSRFGSYVLIWQETLGMCKAHANEGLFKIWMGSLPVVHVFAPELVEPIINSTRVLEKSILYHVFEPWIGEGLIMSAARKWRFRRKLITPTFHFKALNEFLAVMDRGSTHLVRVFAKNAQRGDWFEHGQQVALCTLDIICRTAMGVQVDFNSDDGHRYVRALDQVTKLALERAVRPWLASETIYYRTSSGREFLGARDCLHAFSRRVIRERKCEWEQLLESADQLGDGSSRQVPSFESLKGASGKELAFLDMLMYQHLVEGKLTLEGIREEVDTFMFAGQDTTANTINWAIYLLGLNPEAQRKCQAEVDEVLCGPDEQVDEPAGVRVSVITSEHLARLKYLELVIKETLRMVPTVPMIGRNIKEHLRISDRYVIPKGACVTIVTQALHNDPRHFPRPERFEPERFAPEESLARHPYAYIPFSAGPRNCIGQRFAMMEIKCVIAKLMRNFNVEARLPMDKLRPVGEMVLKPADTPLMIKLTPRH